MQSPIEAKLQLEPPIAFDTEDSFSNDTLDKENVPLIEETPLIIVPPSFGQSESQQDLLTLLEETKTLQADIESKLADSLPPSPFVPRNQLAIEDGNFYSQGMETGTMGEMGGQICSMIGIELEDGEIETSSSEGEEDFELESGLILEGSSKGFGKSDSTIEKPNFKLKRQSDGASGGLGIIWSPMNVKISLVGDDKYWQHCSVTILGRNENFNLFNVCVVAGDFNAILFGIEKSGGIQRTGTSQKDFLDFVEKNHLLDIVLKNGIFTWTNRRVGFTNIVERLDRFLVTGEWLGQNLALESLILSLIRSDHYPICLEVALGQAE
ncbi:hypothetical protein SUGI_0811990 [Cryptomeria japonica]|nr:hypothetical protein SUGI_0811990 [Cryptomeria japonica]